MNTSIQETIEKNIININWAWEKIRETTTLFQKSCFSCLNWDFEMDWIICQAWWAHSGLKEGFQNLCEKYDTNDVIFTDRNTDLY